MRLGLISFAAAAVVTGVCQAQTPDRAQRIVAACTSESAFGLAFGEQSDRVFAPAPDLSPHRATLTFMRTQNSRRLHLAEIVVHLPDAAGASAFLDTVEVAAAASGRFPQRSYNTEEETTTLAAADGSVQLELGAVLGSAYITCVNPTLRRLAWDEVMGRVRMAERPDPPSLPLPPMPAADICQNPHSRRSFVANFETALQSPLEYATALSSYSGRLQQWFGQQLKDRSDYSDADDADLAARMLRDPLFSAEAGAGIGRLPAFLGALSAFTDAREAGNEVLACGHALETLAHIEETTAATQSQWARIEAFYREEASRRGVTLD